MASSRAIKNRIKSTKNIKQITKAMEAVSAVKMRKSVSFALKGRPFALYALSTLKKLVGSAGDEIKAKSPLFQTRSVKSGLVVVIASDKGLAGSFNSNVLKTSLSFINKSDFKVDVVAIGKKSKDFFDRNGIEVVKVYEGAGDYVDFRDVKPISEYITSLFSLPTKNTSKDEKVKVYDQVDIFYTNFVSALKQEVVHRPLLPLSIETLSHVVHNIVPETGKYSDIKNEVSASTKEYLFEPTPETVVNDLAPSLVDIQIYHSLLEANASEHAARMVAMKNASENAKEVIGSLTISYNKARQAQITKELIEIVSGNEALAV